MSTHAWIAPKSIDSLLDEKINIKAGAKSERRLPKGEKPIQLYSFATPNGQKIGIALEELGLSYDSHIIHIGKGDQFTSGFVEISPSSKIPSVTSREEDGKTYEIFETGSILLYLADKTGKLIPQDTGGRIKTISWLFWQCAGLGPNAGQLGHFFRYAPRDKVGAINYGVARYGGEVKRLLSVLDKQLEGKEYVIGDMYTIADIAIYPWVNALATAYEDAGDFLGMGEYKNVVRWVKIIEQRPAVQRGKKVCRVETWREEAKSMEKAATPSEA